MMGIDLSLMQLKKVQVILLHHKLIKNLKIK